MPKPAKKLKPIPEFRSHEEAGEFWMTHDTTEALCPPSRKLMSHGR